MLLVVLVACGLFGVLAYAVLLQFGLIPGSSGFRAKGPETLPPDNGGRPLQPLRRFGSSESPTVSSRIGRMPQGCLVAVLAFSAIWFLLWGIVLVLALRILTSPY